MRQIITVFSLVTLVLIMTTGSGLAETKTVTVFGPFQEPESKIKGTGKLLLIFIEKIGGVEQIDWARLRTADSLILACGLANNVDRIVSNDEHFQHAIPRNLIISFNL